MAFLAVIFNPSTQQLGSGDNRKDNSCDVLKISVEDLGRRLWKFDGLDNTDPGVLSE